MFTITQNGQEIKTLKTGGEAYAFCKQECFKASGYNEFVVFNNGLKFAAFNADDVKLLAERG